MLNSILLRLLGILNTVIDGQKHNVNLVNMYYNYVIYYNYYRSYLFVFGTKKINIS